MLETPAVLSSYLIWQVLNLLRKAMRAMGHDVTLAQAVKMIRAVDEDGDDYY